MIQDDLYKSFESSQEVRQISFKRTGEKKISIPFSQNAPHLEMVSHQKWGGFPTYSGAAKRESNGSLSKDAFLLRLPEVPSHRASLDADDTDKAQNRINHRPFYLNLNSPRMKRNGHIFNKGMASFFIQGINFVLTNPPCFLSTVTRLHRRSQ